MTTDKDQIGPKECFVVCPIGPAGSDTRKRSNQISKHVIRAVLEPMGYRVTRADTIDQSGQITTQIIDKLLNSDLVVADLTDQNPNVFYELAVRHAVSKPFVHLMAEGQTIPFDIQGLRTVFIDHTDLDSVDSAKHQLRGAVENIERGAPVETPVTYTIDLQQLRQSDSSEARGLADMMQEVATIKRAVLQNTNQSRAIHPNHAQLRHFIEILAKEGRLRYEDREIARSAHTTNAHNRWVEEVFPKEPIDDPWGSLPATGAFADEPPF